MMATYTLVSAGSLALLVCAAAAPVTVEVQGGGG